MTRSRKSIYAAFAMVLVVIGSVARPVPVHATVYNVMSTAQLVGALAAANANPGPDIINLAAGLYTPAAFTVTDDLTLNGSVWPGSVMDGSSSPLAYAGVDVEGGPTVNLHVNINNLTIQNFHIGVYSYNGPTGLVTVNGCTITGSVNAAGIGVDAGPVTILNSTVAVNFVGVNVGNEGDPGDAITLENDTIALNTTNGLAMNLVAISVSNTIIAWNNTGGYWADCSGNVVTGGGGGYACSSSHNIDTDGSGGPGFTTVNPMLGPFADHGGPTHTFSLLAGSPATDNGSGCLATDQRGVTRPQGSGCDIGAFELTPYPFVSANQLLPPGGTITTDINSTGPTPSNPLTTSVTSPGGTAIAIQQGPGAGFGILGQDIQITATPDATPSNPFVIVFSLDPSVIPTGETAATIVVLKNGVVVPPCTAAPGTAGPDPCVESRVAVAGGGAQITILSSTASHWGLTTTKALAAVAGTAKHFEFSVFPNPVRQAATVQFSLPTASNVDISVFDLAGRKLATLASGARPAGQCTIAWHDAEQLPAGIYFLRLRAEGVEKTSTVLRVR